jgi:hypothetical protein
VRNASVRQRMLEKVGAAVQPPDGKVVVVLVDDDVAVVEVGLVVVVLDADWIVVDVGTTVLDVLLVEGELTVVEVVDPGSPTHSPV